jgi:hypothetical protein
VKNAEDGVAVDGGVAEVFEAVFRARFLVCRVFGRGGLDCLRGTVRLGIGMWIVFNDLQWQARYS